MRTLMICTLLAMAAASTLSAQSLNRREARQEARIGRGYATGDLNAREARRLRILQNRAEARTNRDRFDGGRFTPAERRAADRRYDRLERTITRQRNDRDRGRGWYGRPAYRRGY